ncbi:YdbH domain-containing protein [Parerythrobacter aurantius]|uniref:intermembrane phospholipid transport protein YdbH family protein n=1 Tax=Parerythrobacter aurantius TaxID=3127706 RepID=UPI0032450F8E
MESGEEVTVEPARTSRASFRIARNASLALLTLIVAGLLVGWLTRERIADNIIADQLRKYGLPGSYEIESIGPTRQAVRNIVIGDPDDPDLTVERVVINLRYRFGYPAIGRIEVTRPRLYGSVDADGRLTFGTLDKVLFAESDEPPGLPDLDVKLVDGRARIDTTWGNVGLKAEGEGELDDGFRGSLAAIAPSIAYEDCTVERLTVFGEVTVDAGRPAIAGPLRAGRSACTRQGISLAKAEFNLGLTGDSTLDGADLRLEGETGRLAFRGGSMAGASLGTQSSFRKGRLVARFDTTIDDPEAQGVRFDSLAMAGGLRGDTGFKSVQLDAEIDGDRLSFDRSVLAGLRAGIAATEATLAAPLLAKFNRALEREAAGSAFSSEVTLRADADGVRLSAPRTSLRSRSGETIATITRFQLRTAGQNVPLLSGNLAMSGAGLPQLRGRMERDGRGAVFRLQMAPYEAEGSRLAVPDMEVRQARNGNIAISGAVEADGPLPNGLVRGLRIPVAGRIGSDGSIRMWDSCTPVRFERLALFNLALDSRQLTLCPPRGQPILRYDSRGIAVAAGAANLDLRGRLGGSPIRIASRAVGLAWPGTLSMRDTRLVIGEEGAAARFVVPELKGQLGRDLRGSFARADMGLDAVPLDIFDAAGEWSYSGGTLAIDGANFRIEDRKDAASFNPLYARDAAVRLAGGRLTARADLREPSSDRVVTAVDIAHDLATGTGSADLRVAGLTFDEGLQPVTLTELARGIVALVEGTVTGTGRIAWDSGGVTSRGSFSTDSLDLAAPFGPVKGASGTVVFTDLLGLTTAPGQRLRIESLNPGIEIDDGYVDFQLREGTLLAVEGGRWPWLGGTLSMRPVALDFSRPETRRYIFDVQGLDAALFVQRLELGNISVTGTFDGTVGVVFDEFGNGFIEDSVLVARPPGGNVSYVGDLTYEDLGAIANFAFRSLKSLDFEQMRVGIEGPLAGEVLTAITFDGVTQGEGADTNFITRRIGQLPIRFNVNVRAPFYQLLNNMRSLYDPEYIRDPRSIEGLMGPTPDPVLSRDPPPAVRPDGPPGPRPRPPQELAPAKPPIQDPESEEDL